MQIERGKWGGGGVTNVKKIREVTCKEKQTPCSLVIDIEVGGWVWYGNILFDIVHNIIENILTKHKNI